MDKVTFITTAIADTQATIRSIDVKIAALLTGMLLPLSSLGHIWSHLLHLSSRCQWVTITIGILFFFLWILAVLLLVRAISAIDNPAQHILNIETYKGSFYGVGLYKFGFQDMILNRSINKATKNVTEFLEEYPNDLIAITAELTFEHMKLIYIRDIKLFRLNLSLKIGFIWLLLGIIIYVISKLT